MLAQLLNCAGGWTGFASLLFDLELVVEFTAELGLKTSEDSRTFHRLIESSLEFQLVWVLAVRKTLFTIQIRGASLHFI